MRARSWAIGATTPASPPRRSTRTTPWSTCAGCAGSRGRAPSGAAASTAGRTRSDVLGALETRAVSEPASVEVDAHPESRVHNSQPHGIGRVVALDGLCAWNNLGRNVVFAGEDFRAASGVRRVRLLGGRAVSVRPRRPRDPRDPERGHRRDAEPPRDAARLLGGRHPATGAACDASLPCGHAPSLPTSSARSSSAIASSDRAHAKTVLPGLLVSERLSTPAAPDPLELRRAARDDRDGHRARSRS